MPKSEERMEQGCVAYQTNVLGTRGPRKMTAIIPSLREDGRPAFAPTHTGETLMDRCGCAGAASTGHAPVQLQALTWNRCMQWLELPAIRTAGAAACDAVARLWHGCGSQLV
jgi:hypothetical protein